jgi:SH3 domain-containing YSC84-like protein 1
LIRTVIISSALIIPIALSAAAHERRLDAAATVLSEVTQSADAGIPQFLIDRSHCVAVVPGMKKGAFIVGARYGRGFVSCRTGEAGGWSSPAAIRIEGGSFGAQIGGKETDLVLLVMNERGANRLLESRFTLGGQASVAAGPLGRTAAAQTDAFMTAEILSWSRARGLFAGVSLNGATLREDAGTNRRLYGRTVSNKDILKGSTAPAADVTAFTNALRRVGGEGTRARNGQE